MDVVPGFPGSSLLQLVAGCPSDSKCPAHPWEVAASCELCQKASPLALLLSRGVSAPLQLWIRVLVLQLLAVLPGVGRGQSGRRAGGLQLVRTPEAPEGTREPQTAVGTKASWAAGPACLLMALPLLLLRV